MPGLVLIVAALFLAAFAGTAEAKLRRVRPAQWPASWPAPPEEFLSAVAEAAVKYQVPAEYLIAFGFVETRFEPWLTGKVRPLTWDKVRDKVVGKSGRTWGQLYTVADMRAHGIMGLMPFNYIGVSGGLAAGAPARGGLPIRFNVFMAARLLRQLYLKADDWVVALHGYNPGGGEEYYGRLRAAIDTYRLSRGAT